MPASLIEKLEVVRVGMDLNNIIIDKFQGVLHYEDKPYSFYGFCKVSENKVMFYDPLRGLYANHTFDALVEYMKDNKDKNLRGWLESLLITGDYGCDMYMGYTEDFYNQLGDINITHILD